LLKLRNRAVNSSNSFEEAKQKLALTLRNGIWQAQQLSILAGINQGFKELGSLDPDFEPIQVDTVSNSLSNWVDAKRYAENFAALWLLKAVAADTNSVSKAAEIANRESLHRLELIAVTESSSAYSIGKSESARAYEGDQLLYKVWDSTMDSNVCSTCAGLDGETVLVTEYFSYGEPGTVHANCRCTYSILTEAETIRLAA
jgi:F like protein